MVVEVGIRMGTKINVPNMNENIRYIRQYISDISVDISPIYPISVMFDTIFLIGNKRE